MEIRLNDHERRERTIRNADDLNRLIGDLEVTRDRLANTMLGPDRDAAVEAELASDWIEDEYVPMLQAEIVRIQALLDADNADAHRRAKARAIKERKPAS